MINCSAHPELRIALRQTSDTLTGRYGEWIHVRGTSVDLRKRCREPDSSAAAIRRNGVAGSISCSGCVRRHIWYRCGGERHFDLHRLPP